VKGNWIPSWAAAHKHGSYRMPLTPVTTSQSGDDRNIQNIHKKDDKENGITPDRLLHMTAQTDLRWGCDSNLANRICNYGNRYESQTKIPLLLLLTFIQIYVYYLYI
jgi:hypothetical protein